MSGAASPGSNDPDAAGLRAELTESCRQAIDALQDEVRPEAELIAVRGDWAWVSIGNVHPAHVNDVFDEEKAHAVIRIPTNFPHGTRPYGIITIPYVTKHDGQDVHQEMRNDQKAEPVEDALGVDDTGMWSYQWRDISWDDPEDLTKALEVVRSRFEKED
ncbi:hypothetical protein [Halobacterium salinarum]|uniref:hypothetical protein n=1 Tax=Halobacterium salinarum TaxID=2242 RepID=UPI00255624DC|nr:hypothetical protein [Halobacterium salinarum]MDL0126621.1 hypothetical protein [Halobacterium salinarum]